MKGICCIDLNSVLPIIAIILSLIAIIIALFVGYLTTRYQIISLINSQLADKAKECNSNLDKNDLSGMPKSNDKVSWIVSSIITAEEIINYQVSFKRSIFLLGYDIQELIDQFYLQLHTTIRLFLQREKFDVSDLENTWLFEVLRNQYFRSTEFLSISIDNDKNKVFEKFHEYSLRRNKKRNKNGTQHAV